MFYQNWKISTLEILIPKFKFRFRSQGFWNSESEDYAGRKQAHDLQSIRLNDQFEDAMSVATQSQSFDALVEALGEHLPAHTEAVPKPITWRFNMMPYGQKSPDNDDAHTFPWPATESKKILTNTTRQHDQIRSKNTCFCPN